MENSRNIICLFDIDGTLTTPRKIIKKEMIVALRELSFKAEIGFLTGSDLDYVRQQLWPIFADSEISLNCHILPCNGTEYYIPNPDSPGNFIEIHKNNMENKIGFEKFQIIMKTIIALQAKISSNDYDIPFTGHHFQNRGSMINWCPIGRNANHGSRRQFVAMDKMYGIRNRFIRIFRETMINEGVKDITIKLGGNTSFDIYPDGWDKTYALKHFPTDLWDSIFVGDRCGFNGNDFEIFNVLNRFERAFETGSPEETIEIIDIHIHKMLGDI